jgi:beta-lactam-binding protein with PASTA domain
MPTNIKQDIFKSIVVDNSTVIEEGDVIDFVVEATGEVKTAMVIKFCGSKKDRRLQVKDMNGSQCEEIWSLLDIKQDSIKIVE